jgi:hypothetical protein
MADDGGKTKVPFFRPEVSASRISDALPPNFEQPLYLRIGAILALLASATLIATIVFATYPMSKPISLRITGATKTNGIPLIMAKTRFSKALYVGARITFDNHCLGQFRITKIIHPDQENKRQSASFFLIHLAKKVSRAQKTKSCSGKASQLSHGQVLEATVTFNISVLQLIFNRH